MTRLTPPPPQPVPKRRPARVARMLALAHRMRTVINAGDVEDRASLSRHLGFSRARITQLLDLLLRAPDIQEQLLFIEKGDAGERALTDRALQTIVRQADWSTQRERWHEILDCVPDRGVATCA